jgi:hypothetical protein
MGDKAPDGASEVRGCATKDNSRRIVEFVKSEKDDREFLLQF